MAEITLRVVFAFIAASAWFQPIARIDADTRELLAQAAAIIGGSSINSFVLSAAIEVRGHHFHVLVGTARNTTEKLLTFHESNCHSRDVSAVSMWLKNTLYPGQRRELFILFNASELESAPVVRPSLLSY